MNESQYLERERREHGARKFLRGDDIPMEEIGYEPEDITSYEKENGVPYIVNKLQIKNDFVVDRKIAIKVRAVDEMLNKLVRDENLRDSTISQDTILQRLFSKMPEVLERMLRSNRNLEVLNFLFREAAVNNRLSSQSYFKLIEDKINKQKVAILKDQLKMALSKV